LPVIYIFYSIHVIVCLFLILVVLLQQGKGADLSVFGGGSTQTAFGARSAATLLHKLTVVSFILFILTTLSIAVYQIGPGGASVLSDVSEEQVDDSTTPPEPGALEAEAEGGETAPAPEAPQAPMPAPEGGAEATTPVEAGEASPPQEPSGDSPPEPGDGGR
jgi:preprotein translocase subunit SecG